MIIIKEIDVIKTTPLPSGVFSIEVSSFENVNYDSIPKKIRNIDELILKIISMDILRKLSEEEKIILTQKIKEVF